MCVRSCANILVSASRFSCFYFCADSSPGLFLIQSAKEKAAEIDIDLDITVIKRTVKVKTEKETEIEEETEIGDSALVIHTNPNPDTPKPKKASQKRKTEDSNSNRPAKNSRTGRTFASLDLYLSSRFTPEDYKRIMAAVESTLTPMSIVAEYMAQQPKVKHLFGDGAPSFCLLPDDPLLADLEKRNGAKWGDITSLAMSISTRIAQSIRSKNNEVKRKYQQQHLTMPLPAEPSKNDIIIGGDCKWPEGHTLTAIVRKLCLHDCPYYIIRATGDNGHAYETIYAEPSLISFGYLKPDTSKKHNIWIHTRGWSLDDAYLWLVTSAVVPTPIIERRSE